MNTPTTPTQGNGLADGFALAARWGLGALFIYMGLHKALHPVDFLKLVRQYELTETPLLLNLVAAGLPWFEIYCGVLLLLGVAVRGTAVVLVGMLVPFTVVVLRYAFDTGYPWMQELYVWQHAMVFMAGAGYTFLHRGHVNVDVVYGKLGDRGKAWVDILGTLGRAVMVSNYGAHHRLASYLFRHTKKMCGFVMGVPTLKEIFTDKRLALMLGLDTNVLVRFLVRDDERQFARAQALIERETHRGRCVLVSQLEDLTLKDVETRLANWLVKRCPNPDGTSPVQVRLTVTKRVLAAELGTVSETDRLHFSGPVHELVLGHG